MEPFSRRMLQLEEESIKAMCQDIIAVKPDVVVTEKGISGKDWDRDDRIDGIANHSLR